MTSLVTSSGRSSMFDTADKENSQHLATSSSSVSRPRQKRGPLAVPKTHKPHDMLEAAKKKKEMRKMEEKVEREKMKIRRAIGGIMRWGNIVGGSGAERSREGRREGGGEVTKWRKEEGEEQG
ncbi:hypothetical protein Scep_024421 [Stephania cephalantha]|uniref:Uncharacterized protein n=1 Tax=Stephania cephalantha TaxID=152367 RepID=A0AAP0EXQ5_9MAGN